MEGENILISLSNFYKNYLVFVDENRKVLLHVFENKCHSPKYIFACHGRCLRITPMKPPGGESKLNLKEDEDGELPEEELEERCVR